MDSEDEKSILDSENEEDFFENKSEMSDNESINDSDNETENESDIEDIEESNINNNDNISETASVIVSDSEDDDDEDDEDYFEKIKDLSTSTLENYHPESVYHNYDEIETLSKVVRDSNNNIIDPFHKTLPILTKYEKARILGQRAKQIDNNAKVFVNIEDNIIDSYVIAEMELKAKKIPFIIKRPLPGGSCEYWKVKDLEILSF